MRKNACGAKRGALASRPMARNPCVSILPLEKSA